MSQRVVLISPYALSVFGGVQEQVLAMSRVLSARGADVLVIAPDARDQATYDTPAKIVRLGPRLSLPANGSRAPLTLSPIAALRAKDAVSYFRPDIVHVHEPFAPLLAWSTLVTHGYPTLGTFHRSGDGPALRYTRPLLTRLGARLDGAVAVSDAAAATIQRAASITCDVLFNGFETERFVDAPRERSVETVLFFVGRLDQRKGVATAIEATREHNAKGGKPWRLVIAGDGPERARLTALAAHDPRVVFLGLIGDAEKRSWMRRVHVLLAPSTHGESFGLVLLEGMASETLVVASDIEGYRGAANGYATLFHPGDASSLERAVLEALTGETEEKIAAARAYAQNWSMVKLMDEYETRYELARQRFTSHQVA
ncbi:MAG TPA: glycosyltransferase family 4 protein [Acidimicrobiales bacterium]|nr:glycosyltransferase family 4 protein [Acidimicrobiales bacterium]